MRLKLILLLLLPALCSAVDLDKVYDDLNQALNSGRIRHPGFDQAYEVLRPLSEQGDAKAMYHMSHLYYLGVGGAKRDAEKASQLIHAAAKKGYAVAQQQLAHNYERGVYGHIDNESAVSWYAMAAKSGSCTAINRLAKAYEYGELGLNKDEDSMKVLREEAAKTCK